MPNPQHRHSRKRRGNRRSHDALPAPARSRCPQCQEVRPPHRVCPHCGSYKGREVMETKEKA